MLKAVGLVGAIGSRFPGDANGAGAYLSPRLAVACSKSSGGYSSRLTVSYPQAQSFFLCISFDQGTVAVFALTVDREARKISNRGFHLAGGFLHETYLSTFRRASQAHSRFPRSSTYPWWPCRYSRTSCQGPSSSERLTPDPVIAVAESECFRPEYRLHQAGEFAAVFQHRRVSRGVLFDLHWRPNGLSTARLGLVVPKRLARRAVLRNLIKRIAREHFRRQRLGLPSMDLILKLARKPGGKSDDQLARPGNVELRGQLAQDVDKLFLALPGMQEKPPKNPKLPGSQ